MKNQSRRRFIHQASAGLIAGLGLPATKGAPPILKASDEIAATDEKFWGSMRKQFLLEPDLIYLNNGTMGPSPLRVQEAVHKASVAIDESMNYGGWDASAIKIGGFVKAQPDEIALTHNVTEGINIFCWGVPLKKGDEVIITNHEHVGSALPWLNRQKLHGIKLVVFSPAPTAAETISRIESLITKKTRVIAVPHLPCSQGQVLPIKEISSLGKGKGLFVFIDGAHGPGMMPLDMHDTGCDAYAGCFHKWMLGPKGTGFLYVKKEFQEVLQPYFVGGGSDNAKWNLSMDPLVMGEYANSAHRFYGGSQNTALFKGVEASIDFMNEIGMENIHRRVKYLGGYAQQSLLEMGDKVELLTPPEDRSRCAITGFRIKATPFDKFYKAAMDEKIRIRAVPENNINCIRVSTHLYNTPEEIDKLMDLVKKAAG